MPLSDEVKFTHFKGAESYRQYQLIGTPEMNQSIFQGYFETKERKIGIISMMPFSLSIKALSSDFSFHE